MELTTMDYFKSTVFTATAEIFWQIQPRTPRLLSESGNHKVTEHGAHTTTDLT